MPDTDQITFSHAALQNLFLRNFIFLLRKSHTLQLTLLHQFDNRVIIFGSLDFGVCLNNLSSDYLLVATSLFLSELSHFWGVGMEGMQSDTLRCSLQYSSQSQAFKTFWPIISLSRLVNMPAVLVDCAGKNVHIHSIEHVIDNDAMVAPLLPLKFSLMAGMKS